MRHFPFPSVVIALVSLVFFGCQDNSTNEQADRDIGAADTGLLRDSSDLGLMRPDSRVITVDLGLGDSTTPVGPMVNASHTSQTFIAPFELTLSTSRAEAQIVYTIDGSSPTMNSTVYAGPITIEATTWLRARILDAPQSEGIDRWFVAVNRRIRDFDSNLPVVVIDAWQRDIDDESEGERPFRPIHIMLLQNDGVRTPLVGGQVNHAGHAAMHVRGSSTARYEKKQYRLELRDAQGEDQDAELLGMPAEADWILQAPYGDKSLIRNVLMYGWSNAIGRYAARTRLVELFMAPHGGKIGDRENDYRGVYVVM